MIYHLSFKKVIFHSELLVYQRVYPPVIKPHQKKHQMPSFCLRRLTLWSLDWFSDRKIEEPKKQSNEYSAVLTRLQKSPATLAKVSKHKKRHASTFFNKEMKTHEQKYVEYRYHPNISIYSLLQYRDLFPRQRPNSAWRGVGWRRLGGSWSPQSAPCDRRRRNPSAPRSLIPARRKGRGTWGCRGWSILAAQKKGWCFMGFDEDIMKDIYI